MSKQENKFEFRDRDLEVHVISSLVQYPDLIKNCDNLILSEDFFFDDTKILFEGIIQMYGKNEAISQALLTVHLAKSGKISIVKQTGFSFSEASPSLSSLKESLNRLRELSVVRKCISFFDTKTRAMQQGEDIFKIVFDMGIFYENIMNNTSSDSVVTMKKALTDTIPVIQKKMQDRINGIAVGVPTGFDNYDQRFGGFQSDEFVVICARPGMGKTIMMLELAKNASLRGKKAFIMSIEMNKESLLNRMLSGQLENEDLTYSRIKSGNISNQDFSKIVSEGVTELSKLDVFWYDKIYDRDINTILFEIERMVRREGIEVVYIDYLQLVEDKNIHFGAPNREYLTVTSVSQKLNKLQKTLGIPIVVFSQLSRETEKRDGKEGDINKQKPKLSDIRSSGQVEQDANVVWGLFRPDYYLQKKLGQDFYPTNELEIIELKNRDGDTSGFSLYIDAKTSRIRNRLSDLNLGAPKQDYHAYNYATNKSLDEIVNNPDNTVDW